MTKEEAITILSSYDMGFYDINGHPIPQLKLAEACDMAIDALSAQADGDLISRQATIDAISCNITITGRQNAELVAATLRTFVDRIKALPSAEPKTGEWITYYPFMLSIEEQRFNGAKNPTEPKPDKRFGRIKCSLCGCPHPIPNDKYCPGCGAEMLNGETWNRRASDE